MKRVQSVTYRAPDIMVVTIWLDTTKGTASAPDPTWLIDCVLSATRPVGMNDAEYKNWLTEQVKIMSTDALVNRINVERVATLVGATFA